MKKRLNIKSNYLFALIVIAFTSFSCSEKIFDEQVGETITPDQHYKSLVDMQVSMAGAFAPLQNVLPKLIVIDGLRSDQMIATMNAEPYLKDINNQVLSFDNPYLDASDYYKVIINTNEALANIYKIAKIDRNLDEYKLKYSKGALVTLRSWTYLNLVRLYGKAALIDDNLGALPANMTQNILEKDVMINLLIDSLLPYIISEEEASKKAELLFINFMSSKAVLGELYLEKGDYANAAKYLKMALESYRNNPEVYKVSSYVNEGWKSMFLNNGFGTGEIFYGGAMLELISAISYDKNEGQFNPLAKWLLPADQFMVQPTQLLVDSFRTQISTQGLPGDIHRGIGASIDTTASGVFYVNKYSADKNDPFSADIIISRASDLHLLLAEALNRNGDSKTALVLLNAGFKGEKPVPALYNKWSKNQGIRGRVTLKSKVVPDSVYELPITADSIKVPLLGEARMLYIEDLIMNERSLELAFEGKRWFDLVRVAKRRQDPSYLANKVAAKFPESEKDAIRTKLMIETNWYLPFKKEVAK